MKLSCNVIADLMPLYVDGACSEESRILVEAHISECDECRSLLDMMAKELPMPTDISPEHGDKEARLAFTKIRRHWKRVIAIVVVLCLIIILGSHEISGGVAISNIAGIISSQRMLDAVIGKDYKKAFSYIDTGELLHGIKSTIPEKIDNSDTSLWSPADWAGFTYKDYTEEEYRSELQANYIISMEALNERGIYITAASFVSVGGSLKNGWRIYYSIEVNNEKSGKSLEMSLTLYYRNGNLTQMEVTAKDESDPIFIETSDAMLDLYDFD